MNAKANGVDVSAVPSVLAVLVPVDGSALSKKALLAADELAERLKLEDPPHDGCAPRKRRPRRQEAVGGYGLSSPTGPLFSRGRPGPGQRHL